MSLSAIFEGGERDIGEQVQNVLRAVRRHLAMDVGFISEFVSGRRVFRFSDGESVRNPVVVGASDPLEKSFCHYVVRGLMPELMQDAAEDPVAAGMPVTRALPVGAHLSVPLRHADGSIYGTLCCFSFSPDRSLTQRDLGTLRLCAEVVSALLQKDREAELGRTSRRERVARIIAERLIGVAYQPIYRTGDGRLMAFEALARFELEPRRPPDAWFAEAAEVGLDVELELVAVGEALAALAQLDPSVALSVNLSPAAVISPGLATLLAGTPLHRLVIELTEHAQVPSYEALAAALKPARAAGLRLAIDDVGAGHSTFRHVLDLAPELIKLDMSLTRNVHADSARRALAEAITSYSRNIGCEVVAEGVETVEEYAALREIGVTRVQGYLTGRPMPLADAAALPLRAEPTRDGPAGRALNA